MNGVAPGPIENTAGLTKLAPGQADALEALWKEHIPIGRLGSKQDIAYAVVFLASYGSTFVNGHTLVVDGAEWMYRQPIVPRESVKKASKAVEATSRAVGLASGGSNTRSRL